MCRPNAFVRRYIKPIRELDTCLIRVGPIILSESTLAYSPLPVIILQVVLFVVPFLVYRKHLDLLVILAQLYSFHTHGYLPAAVLVPR